MADTCLCKWLKHLRVPADRIINHTHTDISQYEHERSDLSSCCILLQWFIEPIHLVCYLITYDSVSRTTGPLINKFLSALGSYTFVIVVICSDGKRVWIETMTIPRVVISSPHTIHRQHLFHYVIYVGCLSFRQPLF